MQRVLLCTFPFPPQAPAVQVANACEFCPNADREVLDQHAQIERDDPELGSAIRSFVDWFLHPDEDKSAYAISGITRYAAELYTREDHTGTCIPKTVLFAYYKGVQFSGSEFMPRLSDAAEAAFRGETVTSWPDGAPRSGPSWNAMFADYSARYE